MSDEQKDEWLKEIAANRARQEALTRQQRFEAGKFSIELVRADDDPPENDPDFQKELSRFGASLREANILYSQTAIAFDAVDGSGHPLPEFILAIRELGPPIIKPLCVLLGMWIQGRFGRKARLKIGDIEAEARTPSEVEELLKTAAKFQKRAPRQGRQ